MEVNFEQFLLRSNSIKNYIISDIKRLSDNTVTHKENAKKWSIVEVIDHLNKVYDIYLPHFEKAIGSARELDENHIQHKQSTLLGRLSIYSMKPKGKNRRFKMKTFDFFQPTGDPHNHEIIDSFIANKETFNELIKQSRTKNLRNIKMPTSLGEKIKFYIPECFEFILAHEERHVVQIKLTLAAIK